MFKTMGYSPAFCSKSANFRPLRIHPKSTQTSAQALTNHFRTVLQAFQRVWSDFQDLPKSAMFKPWAIAQAFCSKSANFRPLRIHPKRFRVDLEVSKIGRFWAKSLGYSPWFEHGRFWQVLEIAPNSLERLQNRSKMICDCLRDCLCRFRVDSEVSKIGWFWEKAWAIAHGLNMADFGKSLKSLQTLWNACKTVLKWFVSACAEVCVDLGWIRKCRKLADFEQKAWAIAHGLNMADFGKSWKSLQTLWNACKTVLKWFVSACADVCVDLGWIRKGRKLADFEQKAWAIAHGLNMADFGKSWKSLQTLWNACKTVLKWFVSACADVCVDLGWIRKGRKLADFEQKAGL